MPIMIYKLDLGPPTRAFLMTAEIIKLNYKSKNVNCIAGETMSPEFIEKNPQHTIPLLEDGDFVLADSHAIMMYVVSKYGGDMEEKLYSRDLTLRATIEHRLFFDATVLFPPCRSIIRGILYKQSTGPSEKQTTKANEAYVILERYLQKTRFVACDHLTLADVSCVAIVSTLDVLVPTDEKYVKIHAWLNRLKEEEWYQKTNVPGLTQLTEQLKITMQKNSMGQSTINRHT